jgi:hypothetical protein
LYQIGDIEIHLVSDGIVHADGGFTSSAMALFTPTVGAHLGWYRAQFGRRSSNPTKTT